MCWSLHKLMYEDLMEEQGRFTSHEIVFSRELWEIGVWCLLQQI